MTVAEIQEFVDERIKYYESLELPNYNSTAYAYFRAKLKEELWIIKGRIGELEPKENNK